MASITMIFSYIAGILSKFTNGILTPNTKTQANPFTGDIEEYGVSGDIAGILISRLNSGVFSEVQGISNSSVQNILSINEYTDREWKELQSMSVNTISRSGFSYFINGNKLNGKDAFNIRFIRLFIAGEVEAFLEDQLFEESDFERLFVAKMNDIEKQIRRYMRSFEYSYTFSGRTVTIDIKENMNSPINRMRFSITYNQ